MGVAADEAIEVLEPAAAAGPSIKRPHRAGLPRRYLMAFAELGGAVPVQLQRLGQGRSTFRTQ